MAVPKYMQKGSKGPHVSLIHAFLCGLDLGEQIVFDQEYGNMTAAAVAKFQNVYGALGERQLEADGNFGPATRNVAKKKFNFDFDAACETIPGVTQFVQPDGSVVSWWPGPGEKIAQSGPGVTA